MIKMKNILQQKNKGNFHISFWNIRWTRKMILMLSTFFFFIPFGSLCTQETERNFESLMEMDFFHTEKYFAKGDLEQISFFKSIYEKYQNKLFGMGSEINSIPKVIHFIWVGPKDFPKNSVKNIESWAKFHPEWKIKFWTDRERPLPVKTMERHFITELKMETLGSFLDKTTNPAEKADILRYEILYNEGGVYVDHDVECFQSFDRLTKRFDFFAFLEPPHYNPGYPYAIFPTNALIGCRPNHSILKKTMYYVSILWDEVEKKYPGNNMAFTRILNRTFFSFTKGIKEEILTDSYSNIVLPASFIFANEKISRDIIIQRIKDYCCLANHTFEGSWR